MKQNLEEALRYLYEATKRNRPTSLNRREGRVWMTVKYAYLQASRPDLTTDKIQQELSQSPVVYKLRDDRMFISFEADEVSTKDISRYNSCAEFVQDALSEPFSL